MLKTFHYRTKLIVLLAISILLGGCAAAKYNVAPNNTDYTVQSDKALVIFMRTSFVGAAITSPLFDISDGTDKLIAIVGSGDKIAYYTDPGEKQFMVIGESADFMDANLEAGKVYYAIITPRMGVWKARFSLHPFKQKARDAEFQLDSPQLVDWLKATNYISPNEASFTWAKENAPSIANKREEYLIKWDKMADGDKKFRRLEPADGLNGIL